MPEVIIHDDESFERALKRFSASTGTTKSLVSARSAK